MKTLALAATLAALAAACGTAPAQDASVPLDSPALPPRCVASIDPVGSPQYAGSYQLYIDGIFADRAHLRYVPRYPHVAGFYERSYDLQCAHLAGWPSYAVCTETGFDTWKYTVSYSGAATLGIQGPQGQSLQLANMTCR